MRSVVVVLPASMCAAMPMLRVRSIVYFRLGELIGFAPAAFSFSNTASIKISGVENKNAPKLSGRRGGQCYYVILPAEMCKCLVGLGHLEDFVAFADGIALPLVGIEDFRGERFLHRDAFAGIGKIHQP